MSPNEGPRVRREATFVKVTEEIDIPNGYHRVLTQLVETKQKEGLLRFFYVPFWKACSATLVLLVVILGLSGAWVLTFGLLAVCGFPTYMASRSGNQLKRIKEQLREAKTVEIASGRTAQKDTITGYRSSDKREGDS